MSGLDQPKHSLSCNSGLVMVLVRPRDLPVPCQSTRTMQCRMHSIKNLVWLPRVPCIRDLISIRGSMSVDSWSVTDIRSGNARGPDVSVSEVVSWRLLTLASSRRDVEPICLTLAALGGVLERWTDTCGKYIQEYLRELHTWGETYQGH